MLFDPPPPLHFASQSACESVLGTLLSTPFSQLCLNLSNFGVDTIVCGWQLAEVSVDVWSCVCGGGMGVHGVCVCVRPSVCPGVRASGRGGE